MRDRYLQHSKLLFLFFLLAELTMDDAEKGVIPPLTLTAPITNQLPAVPEADYNGESDDYDSDDDFSDDTTFKHRLSPTAPLPPQNESPTLPRAPTFESPSLPSLSHSHSIPSPISGTTNPPSNTTSTNSTSTTTTGNSPRPADSQSGDNISGSEVKKRRSRSFFGRIMFKEHNKEKSEGNP